MALYLFKNPKTGEIKEVIQSVHDEHSYYEDGVKFEREFVNPQISIDTKIDCQSSIDFVEKTGRKRGTVNDLWQTSAELSEKRARIHGEDPIKKEYQKKYKETRGKDHPEIGAKEAKEKLDKLGVIYE